MSPCFTIDSWRKIAISLIETQPGILSVMAFHEKAGLRQVDFDLSFLKFSLSFMAEGLQSGPERSRARSLRRSEPLTARTALSPFRQEGKGAVIPIVCLSSVPASRPNPHCRHPSIRTLNERLIRSVQVGCSRCSRCCHLLVDLSFHLPHGSRARPLTQSPELGAGARCFRFGESKLCGGRQWHRSAVAQRFVSLSAHPQAMQQDGELSRGRDHRSFLPILSATLR